MTTDGNVTRINGTLYKKSLASKDGGNYCVGVALRHGRVSVINTKTQGPAIEFTLKEWAAFLKGVEAGEFDPRRLPS